MRAGGAGLLLLCGAYFLAAQVGGVLSLPGSFATFWPPSGLLLAALLVRPRRRWPLTVLAVLPANLAFDLLHGQPVPVSLAYWGANSLEAAGSRRSPRSCSRPS